MAYDIYGEYLRPGHCEVHPDVRHEYPCPCCTNEYEEYCRQQEERAYYEDLESQQYEAMVAEAQETKLLDQLEAFIARLEEQT